MRPRMRRYSPGLRVVRAIVRCCGLPKAGGVTAWDTQCVKEIQLETDPRDVLTKKALMGALALYLDFINLFVMLLQLVGQRRE